MREAAGGGKQGVCCFLFRKRGGGGDASERWTSCLSGVGFSLPTMSLVRPLLLWVQTSACAPWMGLQPWGSWRDCSPTGGPWNLA